MVNEFDRTHPRGVINLNLNTNWKSCNYIYVRFSSLRMESWRCIKDTTSTENTNVEITGVHLSFSCLFFYYIIPSGYRSTTFDTHFQSVIEFISWHYPCNSREFVCHRIRRFGFCKDETVSPGTSVSFLTKNKVVHCRRQCNLIISITLNITKTFKYQPTRIL